MATVIPFWNNASAVNRLRMSRESSASQATRPVIDSPSSKDYLASGQPDSPHSCIQIISELLQLRVSVLTARYNERPSVGAVFKPRKKTQARGACLRFVPFQKSMYRYLRLTDITADN